MRLFRKAVVKNESNWNLGATVSRRVEAAMIEFHKIWIEQCEGEREVKERFGVEKALGYLIGEKLVNFVRASDTHPEFAQELPNFVAEIKRIFGPQEIQGYLQSIRRVGPTAHIGTDEEIEFMRKEVLIVERIKEMLLQ
jgi:hypothetical protein